MKRFRWTFPALGSALIIAGAVAAARPQYGGTLRVEIETTLGSLDPAAPQADAAGSAARDLLLPLIFETLVTPDPAGGLRPLLAISWESDARARRWRFRLRPGLTLHDGSTLGPAQVAATLGAKNDGWKVAATDEGIVIEADRELPDLPWELADIRHAIAVRLATGKLVGTGPFRIDESGAGGADPRSLGVGPQAVRNESGAGRLLLRTHEDYWAGRAFIDAIQIDMGRPAADQLARLELGRADIVTAHAPDTGRLSQRGLRIASSRPIELIALVFEGQRATGASDAVRRALALAVDRSAICEVLLRRQGEPARTLLPQWLTGYASLLAAANGVSTRNSVSARAVASSLSAEQRILALRIDASGPVARSIAERIAVDGREAGLTINIDPTGTLAPRPDVRLVGIRLAASSPERALAALVAALGPRVTAALSAEAPPGPGSPLDTVYRFERGLLDHHIIVPVVHVPELHGLGKRIESWDPPIVLPSGALNLASIWLGTGTP
jgi:peptide/nickel transport system substrate-binding protein